MSDTKKALGRPRTNKLTLGEMIAYLKNGMTPTDIARMAGVTPVAVRQRLKNHGVSLRALKAYKAHKADVMAHAQIRILEALDEGKIGAAGIRDLVGAFGVLNNAERLERGQSTQNLNLQAMVDNLAELEAAEAKLKAQIGMDEVEPKSEGGE